MSPGRELQGTVALNKAGKGSCCCCPEESQGGGWWTGDPMVCIFRSIQPLTLHSQTSVICLVWDPEEGNNGKKREVVPGEARVLLPGLAQGASMVLRIEILLPQLPL